MCGAEVRGGLAVLVVRRGGEVLGCRVAAGRRRGDGGPEMGRWGYGARLRVAGEGDVGLASTWRTT